MSYEPYGKTTVGFGERPAILVVDFQKAFTDPKFSLGGSELIDRAVNNTASLLENARRFNVPIIKCFVGFSDKAEVPYWKIPSVSNMILGSEECELDSRIHNDDYDVTIVKQAPSIFFGTSLMSFLVKHQVDTTIVTGCVTSGCIRASVVDSFSYGYRTMVPEDCVGDQELKPHEDNLRDVGRRYADITTSEEVKSFLESNSKRNNI